MRCPRCAVALAPEARDGAQIHRCPRCRGVAVNVAVLRQFAPAKRMRELWLNLPAGREGATCPWCARPMRATPLDASGRSLTIDVCRPCQSLWVGADDLKALATERPAARLSPAAREAVAIAEIEGRALGDQSEIEAWIVTEMLASLIDLII